MNATADHGGTTLFIYGRNRTTLLNMINKFITRSGKLIVTRSVVIKDLEQLVPLQAPTLTTFIHRECEIIHFEIVIRHNEIMRLQYEMMRICNRMIEKNISYRSMRY